MHNLNIACLCSEDYYNLDALNLAIKSGILPINLKLVIINSKCKCIEYCKKNKINNEYLPWDSKKQQREKYDKIISDKMNSHNIDIILLSNWSHSFGLLFKKEHKTILKVNPVYSSVLKSSNITEIFNHLSCDRIKSASVTVELLNQESSRNTILSEIITPYCKSYTLDDFINISKRYENTCLVKSIIHLIESEIKKNLFNSEATIYNSHVKFIKDINYNILLFEYRDSEFINNIKKCKTKNKGKFISIMNKWWFKKTKYIIDNHYIWNDGKFMSVKKTKPINLIFEVHGYLANTFSTKLYDIYKNGARNIAESFNIMEDNLEEYAKLTNPVINIIDKNSQKSITSDCIIKKNILSKTSLKLICSACINLFNYANKLNEKIGITLSCSQYEFGTINNEIILIDDLHCPHNSIYWKNQEECYTKAKPIIYNNNPINNWYINQSADIQKDSIEVPKDVIKNAELSYLDYLTRLYKSDSNNEYCSLNTSIRSDSWTWTTAKNIYLNYNHNNMICLVTQNKELPAVNKLIKLLKADNIYVNILEVSPYKDIIKLISHVKQHDSSFKNMIWITISNHINPISGIISANTRYPVINTPATIDNKINLQSFLSSIQEYKDNPVLTILDLSTIPEACRKIFNNKY